MTDKPTAAVANLKANLNGIRESPLRAYCLGLALGFAAGAVFVASRKKPCPCKELHVAPPPPWAQSGVDVPPPRPQPTMPPRARQAPPPPPAGPPVAEVPPDFIEPSGPAAPPLVDPGLMDAFQRFHMGDTSAYEHLGS